MFGKPEITLAVNDRALLRAIRQVPKIANSEFNRGFARITGGFYKAFMPRLRGAGITVRRKLASGRSKQGVPAVARAMGFTSKIRPFDRLTGKTLSLFSSAPHIQAHEFGATIKPRHGKFLAIGKAPRFTKVGRFDASKHGKVVRRVQSVTLRARLGFYNTWRSFQPQARFLLAKVGARIVGRANRLGKDPTGRAIVVSAA